MSSKSHARAPCNTFACLASSSWLATSSGSPEAIRAAMSGPQAAKIRAVPSRSADLRAWIAA